MLKSLRCVYGHGFRAGAIVAPVLREECRSVALYALRKPPSWMPTRLHRFVWRQGLRNGVGARTIISSLTLMFIGE